MRHAVTTWQREDLRTINASFTYAPFGEIVEATDAGGPSSGVAKHPRRFNDKFFDEISGLGYYGYRYYDTVLIAWTQSDPLYRFAPDAAWSMPRQANLYTVDLNNPLRYLDPDGRYVPEVADAINEARLVTAEATKTLAANPNPLVKVAAVVCAVGLLATVTLGPVTELANRGGVLDAVDLGTFMTSPQDPGSGNPTINVSEPIDSADAETQHEQLPTPDAAGGGALHGGGGGVTFHGDEDGKIVRVTGGGKVDKTDLTAKQMRQTDKQVGEWKKLGGSKSRGNRNEAKLDSKSLSQKAQSIKGSHPENNTSKTEQKIKIEGMEGN